MWSTPQFPKPFIQLCACQELRWVRAVAKETFYTNYYEYAYGRQETEIYIVCVEPQNYPRSERVSLPSV